MPFEFECPHCGSRTYVDDRYSGQTGPCADCGKTVTIPMIGRGGVTVSPTASGGGGIVAVMLVIGIGVVLSCAGFGMFWLRAIPVAAPGPAVVAAAASSQCDSNLRTLAVAMHSYHSRYQSFPPAYLADEDGEPMHSWRVLLLPFLGHDDLYRQYDFDEPWNGPNNEALITMMPAEYTCPDDMLSSYDQTSYAMIVGPGMLSDGESASRFADIRDGTSPTLMFVEAHGSGIVWTEPRDLDGTTMSFLINSGQVGELQGHTDYVLAAFCDSAVHELPDKTPPEDIRAMATIDGGEAITVPGR